MEVEALAVRKPARKYGDFQWGHIPVASSCAECVSEYRGVECAADATVRVPLLAGAVKLWAVDLSPVVDQPFRGHAATFKETYGRWRAGVVREAGGTAPAVSVIGQHGSVAVCEAVAAEGLRPSLCR